MPPLPSRMTKNQGQPARYYPGKAEVEENESEDEESEEEQEEVPAPKPAPKPAPPKASSFPSQKKLAVDLSKADQQRSLAPNSAPQKPAPDEDLEGFVTASESSESDREGGTDEGEEEDSSEEDEESSDDEPKKPMLRPTFMSKAKRAQQSASRPLEKSAEEIAAEEERKRKEKADEMLQLQLERDAAARAAGRRAWDDDAEIAPEDMVDDTDDIDPEAEKAAWKLRELKRVKRDRLAIEEKEKEREEIERRRNMTAEEREAEDKAYIEAQKEEREGKGKMGYMQKYFHKGAFSAGAEAEQDEEVKAVLNRDLSGARYADETGDKSVLPEYMRIRDMSQLGKKGRTKYKDLKNEDTGRWGADLGRKKREFDGVDDRFKPDDKREGGRDQTGANSMPVGERRRREDDDGRDGKRPRYD
ncbi:hypothetical protein D0869_06139 [Hortaea werneckii]|uniref:Micro-fibrillar-associated protein 1 C-terminal domain-containing protein n=1 Tax=Hortaea werneckii TaxID=91943 RepID=A0A3M6WUM5_HORWE|nr:hypothetical protein KC324_g1012 [Hortaea werneckii]KAI7593951.1 hypothetical protein KC316_g1428 [Hortaea werneckii]RMX82323.1 hypothetical protein D0869_06139 [Hortaea werneckii]